MPAQTIFVGSLPDSATNQRLEEIFSEIGPVKQCFVVREKGAEKCRGFGFVTYSMEEDAERALKEIKEYDGKKLSLTLAKKKRKDKHRADKEAIAVPHKNEQESKGMKKNLLKSRLIIRNLSFKCTEDDLKEVFGKFGTVVEAKIPLKPDGKMRGFAFVLFKTVSGAGKALKAMNLKEIKGRQVAVDWAVPKDKYIASQHPSGSGNKSTKDASTDTESETEDEDEEKKEAAPEKKKIVSKAAAQQMEESQSSDDNSEEGEEDDEEEEDEDDDDEKEEDEEEEEEDEGSTFDSNDDQDDSEDEEDEEDQSVQKKPSKNLLPSDVKEGRTVFIRNLSFDTDEEGLEEVLLQYGELNYIKIVLHPDTEHSKGCAFAQFKTKEAADKCMAAAQNEAENGGIRVDGRKLFIVAAVSREDAVKMKDNKTKVETGIRNLYLAREGLIRPGSQAAEGVSEADMTKRARFEDIKRAKLRDINVFVSKTRLCIHNLPKSVDNKKLKALCFRAVKGVKGARITECRVMYDKKPVKGQVMGQSLGFGFVQFQDHEHALSTLRYLNNNPDIFSSHKRPIVEFSLEDSRKLKIKEKRQQKNKDFLQNQSARGGEKPQSQISGDGKGARKGGNRAPTQREQGIPERQKQDGRFSGFRTNSEIEYVDLQNGKKRKKVLPMPSRRGPKIRMRDKGKQQAPPPKKAKPGTKWNEHQRRKIEKPVQPRKQVKTAKRQFKSRDGDRFDSLVEQYKKKLIDTSNKNPTIKRSKWFES
ncbi:LOW QUALITY PROTEIN: RNA-binding protein 28 [Melanotaenia boesemani]|uniref:LOW QUALITY PROTEIN: RNA-binding protein 28 n=1 Tax=Melanotaenia boesemani TaxID=1250792 RepID=UPI001C0571A0|nr:LOW QUALITY PROTEIN: RNA-binding protein 28 [Melanotaenia boesemani]